LSFGSETGRTRSGTKGFSSKQKKLKRRKQEFHTHRRGHAQESEQLNPEELRARTILSLDRLGHQILSTEQGGYDLEDWMRSLNSLLDDFEEKIGADKVSEELRARRKQAVLSLSMAPTSAPDDVVSEIERLTQEEVSATEAIAEFERKAAATLASLKGEREACANDLKIERKKLAELREAKQSRQFFSRLLSAGPSTEQAETRVAELERKHSKLEEDIDRLRKARSALAEGDPAYVEALRRLDAARDKLADLQSAREVSRQLTREREIATKTIAEVVSSMELDRAPSGEGGVRGQ
jgi:hypothetical protein